MLTNYGKILRMIRSLKIRLSCSVYVSQFCCACFSGCAYSQQLRSWSCTWKSWKQGFWKWLKKLLFRGFCICCPDTKFFWSKTNEKMTLSVQHSFVKSFKFNGKNIRAVCISYCWSCIKKLLVIMMMTTPEEQFKHMFQKSTECA